MIEDMSVHDTVDHRMQSIKKSPGILTSNITIMLTFNFYEIGTKLVNQYAIQSCIVMNLEYISTRFFINTSYK